ncbi:MAG: hypothetical protein QOG51_1882 [Verrucomicrobiota bacterium]|jgi:hypothetical protein
MRLLLEIILAAALLALAWQKSFKEWVSEIPVVGQHFTAPAQAPQTKTPVAPVTSAASPKAFTRHIYYTDEHGKSYWLDAQGKRHYEP